ncbi:hypothetical protein D3C71_1547230 [compost metagenome]
MTGKITRRLAVAGEQAGPVAVLVGVYHRHRLFQRSDPNHAQHRAEDLLLINPHARSHVVKQRWAKEITLADLPAVVPHRQLATVDHQGSSLLNTLIDIAFHFFIMLLGDQRPHVVAVIVTGTDPHGRHLPL